MSVLKIKLGACLLVVVGAAVAFARLYNAQVKLNDENVSLRQQLTQLQTENGSLSNRLAAVDTSKGLAFVQLNELLKLRGEMGQLQQNATEIDELRKEIQQLQAERRDAMASQASADALDQQQQAAVDSLNHARQGVLAFIMYANENQQQFPPTFTEAAPYFKEGLEPIELNFEIVYIGSVTNITNAAETVVLREKHATQTLDGKWRKTYGFADGHAEIQTEPDGNFDGWENQHIIPPPVNQWPETH